MDYSYFKKRLESEKEQLAKEIDQYSQEDPYLDKYRSSETFDDSITEIEGHDRVTATKTELQRALNETIAALDRIEKGTYGICQNCGQTISQERLEAIPGAAFCTSCQDSKKRA